MPLKIIPYDRLEPLIKDNLETDEDVKTNQVIKDLVVAKKRGYLLKPELEKICKWKSPRAIQLIKSNTEKRIIEKTEAAFKTRSERKKWNSSLVSTEYQYLWHHQS